MSMDYAGFELTQDDIAHLRQARKLITHWTSAPDQVKDAFNAVLEGYPINELEPDIRTKMARLAEHLEEAAMEIDWEHLHEAAYTLRMMLENCGVIL